MHRVLQAFVDNARQLRLKGQVAFDNGYDYKAVRKRDVSYIGISELYT